MRSALTRSARVVALLGAAMVVSGNTGCQSLAVTIRGLTLDEFRPGVFRRVLVKETLLGTLNGAIVGVVAGAAMIALGLMRSGDDGDDAERYPWTAR